MEYQISRKTQLDHLISLVVIPWVLLAGFLCYLIYPQLREQMLLVSMYGGLTLTVLVMPAIFLYINYYLLNKNDKLTVNTETGNLVFYHDNLQIAFKFEDISSLIFHKAFVLRFKEGRRFFASDYFYAVIRLNDQTRIVVTSLLVGKNFTLPLPESKINIQLGFNRWSSGSSLT